MQSKSILTMAGAATVLLSTAAGALAAPGFVDERTALRAGPSARYPTIDIMRSGESVEIVGCLARWTWCDVIWRGERGWARGSALEVPYQSRRAPIVRFGQSIGVPFIQFDVQRYWGDYYRDRPFYRNIPRFGGRIDGDARAPGRDGDVRDRNGRGEDRVIDPGAQRPGRDVNPPRTRDADTPRVQERRPEGRPDRGADRPPPARGPAAFGNAPQAQPPQTPPPAQAAPTAQDAPRGRGGFGGGAAPKLEQPPQAPPRGRGNNGAPDANEERGEQQPFGRGR